MSCWKLPRLERPCLHSVKLSQKVQNLKMKLIRWGKQLKTLSRFGRRLPNKRKTKKRGSKQRNKMKSSLQRKMAAITVLIAVFTFQKVLKLRLVLVSEIKWEESLLKYYRLLHKVLNLMILKLETSLLKLHLLLKIILITFTMNWKVTQIKPDPSSLIWKTQRTLNYERRL